MEVAQRLERISDKDEVRGSIPREGTVIDAKRVEAPGCDPGYVSGERVRVPSITPSIAR